MTHTESTVQKSAAHTVAQLIVAESELDRKARDPHREQGDRAHYAEAARLARKVKRELEAFLRSLDHA